MMNEWLFGATRRPGPRGLGAEGNPDDWGAGDSVAEEELPPAPTGVVVKPGNGRITVSWEPVPDAMYYNLYLLTSKGVQNKCSVLMQAEDGIRDLTVTGVQTCALPI